MSEVGREALDALVDLVAERVGKKQAAGVFTATRLHGIGGLFTLPAERDVITAMVRPQGLSGTLRRFPSVFEDPTFESITGFTDVVGSQPSSACQDAPYGYIKGCRLTARFGLARFDTKEIEMDQVMRRVNRGDPMDLRLRGELLGMTGLTPSGLNQQQVLNIMTMSEMVGAAVQMERFLNIQDWQGTIAAGSYPGLDSQIATGQVDADTNVACPALDSDVKNFGYNDVCGTTLDIVEYMSMMAYMLQWNADSMGLSPVQWVVVMRPPLWYELSACWPCKYMTNRCLTGQIGESVVRVDGGEQVEARDRMRRDMQIPINGRMYPVVLDTGIFEHNNANNANLAAGEFASSIYFVPLTITGGFPSTYREYVDYRQSEPDRALLRGKEDWFWTDNGMYSWAISQQYWCYKLALKTEMRVVLRTPHLAGKIEHVMYSPLQHLREPAPDSPYHQDGGASVRGTGTRWAVWGAGGFASG